MSMNVGQVDRIKESLRKHEGWRATIYQDTVGVPTVGYGHNLNTPITKDAGELILMHDIFRANMEARASVGDFDTLSEARQNVLIEMAFNLGGAGLRSFKNMIAAIGRRDWPAAAEEMLDSKWATQVGWRAEALAERMRAGV